MSLMLTCQDVSGLVSDYLDERLTLWERVRFRAHVALCRDCQVWVSQLEHTRETLGHLPDVEVPDELAPGLVAAFQGWTRDASAEPR